MLLLILGRNMNLLLLFIKKFGLPVKTNARCRSDEFWRKMGFQPAHSRSCSRPWRKSFCMAPAGVGLQN